MKYEILQKKVNLNVQNNYSNNILTPNESKVSLETNSNIIFIDVLTDISIIFIINQGEIQMADILTNEEIFFTE